MAVDDALPPFGRMLTGTVAARARQAESSMDAVPAQLRAPVTARGPPIPHPSLSARGYAP